MDVPEAEGSWQEQFRNVAARLTQPSEMLRQLLRDIIDRAFVVVGAAAGSVLIPDHKNAITGLAFSLSAKRLVSGSQDKTVFLWNTLRGKSSGYLEGEMGPVEGLALSPDDQLLACASQDQRIHHLWDLNDSRHLRALVGHRGPVHGVAFTPDGQQLVSGGGHQCLFRRWSTQLRGERCQGLGPGVQGRRQTALSQGGNATPR